MSRAAAPARELLDVLSSLTGTGAFCVGGVRDFIFPELRLAGGEELALPLSAAQVPAIEAAGEAAPYGKGETTVRDEDVRRCRQIDAAEFDIANPAWGAMVDGIAASVGEAFGVAGKVKATPYKLLLYGKGGHFKPHRDTEKLAAMFGTLVVVLPSRHSGGELRVRHAGREERFRFDAEDRLKSIQYAAFFADCEHEVRPVKSGYRLCLVYNLTRPRSRKERLNLAPGERAEGLIGPLCRLAGARPGDLDVILLDHRYPEKGFSVAGLKGADRLRAAALLEAAEAGGLIARLALCELYQLGQLEDDWDGYDSDTSDHEDEGGVGEMGDLIEEGLTLTHWRDAADRSEPLGSYSIERSCLVAAADPDAGEPDEEFAEGYTGNAGCTKEHWYRRAAVVVWRPEDEPGITARYRFGESVGKWVKAARGRQRRGADFHALGGALIGAAEPQVARYTAGGLQAHRGTLFALARGIAECGDAGLMARAEKMLLPAIAPQADTGTLAALVRVLGAQRVVALCSSPEAPVGGEGREYVRRARLRGAADTRFRLLAALLKNVGENGPAASEIAGELAPLLPHVGYQGVSLTERAHLAIAASYLLEEKAKRNALRCAVLDGGNVARVREVLAPALLQKSFRRLFAKPGSFAAEVLSHCVEMLEAEDAKAIAAFPDWRRFCPPALVEKKGARGVLSWGGHQRDEFEKILVVFRRFMGSADTETSRFPARQDLRDMLTGYIDSNQLDLEYRVEKRGSPYALVCTKTSASLTRDRALQKADRKLLAELRAIEISGR